MKLGFQSTLRAEDLPTGKRKLLSDLPFWDGKSMHVVNAEFETDGTSVPWFLRWWVSPWKAPYSRCAVLHDDKYYFGDVNRKKADDLFYMAIKIELPSYIQAITPVGTVQGLMMRKTRTINTRITAKLLYLGVRTFGWHPWNQHRKRSKSGGVS